MQRLLNPLPKYRKHGASSQAVVTISGRDHYLGPHGTQASKHEYDQIVADYRSSGRSPCFGAPHRAVTVFDLANE